MAGGLLWLMVSCLTTLSLWETVRAQTTRGVPTPTDILPSFSTPFGPQQGACSAWEQIAGNSNGVCTVDSSCTHLRCDFLGNMISLGVLPCTDPLAVSVVMVRNGSVLYNNSFSQSEVIPVTYSGLTLKLNVTVIPSPDQDAITIGVTAIPPALIPGLPATPISLIPETTIPVDRTQCNATGAPPTAATQPPTPTSHTPSGTPPHAQTCQALQRIASSSGNQCHTSQSCTTLDCTVGVPGVQYHMIITVLPCDNPPDIRFVIHSSSGNTIVNETLSQSRSQPITFQGVTLFTLVINITHTVSPDAIVLRVHTQSTLGDSELIPNTTIPLDRSNCSSLPPSTGTTPSTPPPVSKTCQALQQIQSTATGCTTSDACTSVLCDFLFGQVNLTVLPCNEPPAISVKVTSTSDGRVIIDDVLTRSRLENVTVGATTVFRLNVTVRHTADAILLKIDGVSPTGDVTPLVPETRIPIDRCDCPNVECVATTSSGGGHQDTTAVAATITTTTTTTTATATTAATETIAVSQLVKIVVPVGVVLILLIVGMIVLIVVCVAYKSKKRARAYTFHRMTFSNVNDDDEEEDE